MKFHFNWPNVIISAFKVVMCAPLHYIYIIFVQENIFRFNWFWPEDVQQWIKSLKSESLKLFFPALMLQNMIPLGAFCSFSKFRSLWKSLRRMVTCCVSCELCEPCQLYHHAVALLVVIISTDSVAHRLPCQRNVLSVRAVCLYTAVNDSPCQPC